MTVLHPFRPLMFALLAVAFLAIACEREIKPGSGQIDAQYLYRDSASDPSTSKTWLIFQVNRNGNSQALDSCEIDDRVTFRANGTGVRSQGTEACDSSAPALTDYDFRWEFDSNSRQITFYTPFPNPNRPTAVEDTLVNEVFEITPGQVRIGYSTPGQSFWETIYRPAP